MESDCCRSTDWGLRIALGNRTDNAEAHAEYKSTFTPIFLWYTRAYMWQCAKCVPHRHKRDILYPVGHLPLLSPDSLWKLRSFNPSEQSAINAFLICLESRDWGLCQTSWLSERGHFPPSKPRRWTFGRKDTTIFWNIQQICAFFVKNLDIRQKMITFAA